MSTEAIKKKIGAAAAELIQDGMLVGLGTGSTAAYFIESLIERCRRGLKIEAVASSKHSMEQARLGGIPFIDINSITALDITVDGADEIDAHKRMIKGGGGALVREKIVANMSREMVVIVDETKLSPLLGKRKLPVEIIPFGYRATQYQLEKLGYDGAWRKRPGDAFYVTDNGNYILDIHFKAPLPDPERDHAAMIAIPGVVDTGFFFNMAGRIVVGFFDGQIVVR